MTTHPSTRRARRRGTQRHLWSRRIRALLASGLVLGVGATITLAAWNDSEYATGSVTAGGFTLEGSPTGEPGSFAPSGPDSQHSLTFSPNADAMYPGETTYSLFSVRTQEGSVGGTIRVLADEGNTGGLGEYLIYGLSLIDDGVACSADTYSTGTEILTPSPNNMAANPDSEQELSPSGGKQNYCIALTLPLDAPNGAQNASVNPEWQFLGTSVSE